MASTSTPPGAQRRRGSAGWRPHSSNRRAAGSPTTAGSRQPSLRSRRGPSPSTTTATSLAPGAAMTAAKPAGAEAAPRATSARPRTATAWSVSSASLPAPCRRSETRRQPVRSPGGSTRRYTRCSPQGPGRPGHVLHLRRPGDSVQPATRRPRATSRRDRGTAGEAARAAFAAGLRAGMDIAAAAFAAVLTACFVDRRGPRRGT